MLLISLRILKQRAINMDITEWKPNIAGKYT